MACKCHVHAAWSCANCQINYKYLLPVTVVAVVTVPCSANGFIWCFQLNQLKSFSPTIVGLSSCYTPNCLTKSHLCLLPTSTLPAFFKTFRPSLCHYLHSVTTAVALPSLSLLHLIPLILFQCQISLQKLTLQFRLDMDAKTAPELSFYILIASISASLHSVCFLLLCCFFFLNTPPKLLFIVLCIAHELGTNFAKRN